LHFQFQSTPYIGSTTIDYPFGNFLLKKEKSYQLNSFENPVKNDVVANPAKNEVLQKAMHFIPGQRLGVNVKVESNRAAYRKIAGKYSWIVETDVLNTTFIRCENDDGKAYLYYNGDLHHFTNFTGTTQSALYWFFVALFKVPMGFLPNSKISDTIPLNLMFGGVLKLMQDFIAPVFLFLKVDYKLTMKEAGDILSSGDVEMNAKIIKMIAGRKIKEYNCELKINQQGTFDISVDFNQTRIKIQCQNELE
jgi:hypothetical protein